MITLDGFHLRLSRAVVDRPLWGATQQAELRALLQPLSGNDCEASAWQWAFAQLEIEDRQVADLFIPLGQATDPAFWSAVSAWIQSQAGRTLRLRFKNMVGTAQSLEEILPLLEKALRELTAIVRQRGV